MARVSWRWVLPVAAAPWALGAGCIGDPPDARPAASAKGAASRPVRPASAVPELTVPPLGPGEPISIDGVLDDPAWGKAADTGPFVNVGTGQPAPELPVSAHAKLLWDSSGLYVGYEVRDANVRGGWPAGATDAHLWDKDTVELMLDPDGDGDNKDYYEIQVNPQNLTFDSQFDDYNLPKGGPSGPFGHQEWSAALESAVRVHGTLDDPSAEDQGYTVELRLPWSSLTKARRAPPGPGDTWRMNLYAMKDNGGVAWSPILGQGNFHRASRFGRVHFVGPAPGTAGSASAAPATSASASSAAAAAR
jgi:hypothetical protein